MPPSGSAGESGTADAGEFPSGEFPGQGGDMPGDGEADSSAAEPGFEDRDGTGEGEDEPGLGTGGSGGTAEVGLPDMSDEPSLEDIMGAFEEAMGDAAGSPDGTGSAPQGSPTGEGTGGGGGPAGSGPYGIPGETEGSPGGGGTLTPAEQVAILDAQLEKGTGEFDAMVLEEQAAQRRAAREQAARQAPSGAGSSTNKEAAEGAMADAGGYSTGGGMGGASIPGGGGASSIPRDTAKYPPPADIPSGNDDDVVARQLREAAMRESDPAVREKLWDEYRKYKGVSS